MWAEFAFLRVTSVRDGLPGPRVWAVLRRSLSSVAELKVHLSNAPRSCERRDLAQMTGWRWPIETTFEEAKGEVGMDQYETRSWPGWHHHMAQSFMAHLFLMRLRLRLKKSAGLDNRPGAPIGRVRITGRPPALSQYHCHH
jgi:SRSO17 transposase